MCHTAIILDRAGTANELVDDLCGAEGLGGAAERAGRPLPTPLGPVGGAVELLAELWARREWRRRRSTRAARARRTGDGSAQGGGMG